jgi:hypothetical protein
MNKKVKEIIAELRKEIRYLEREYTFQSQDNDDNSDPPLSIEEQNRISRKLERLDRRIELKGANIKLLKTANSRIERSVIRMTDKYQITERVDWFYEKEIIKILRELKVGEKVEIIKLEEGVKW